MSARSTTLRPGACLGAGVVALALSGVLLVLGHNTVLEWGLLGAGMGCLFVAATQFNSRRHSDD